MEDGHNRQAADERLEQAREQHAQQTGNKKERVFYKQRSGISKSIPVTRHTHAHLELADALRLRIRLGEFALDLGDSLERLAEEQVEVLERQLKRARY